MDLEKQYKKETGEDATYRMKSSDYHTLKYVKWQVNKIESLKARIEELEKDKPLEVCKCGDIKDVIYCSKCKKVWQVY